MHGALIHSDLGLGDASCGLGRLLLSTLFDKFLDSSRGLEHRCLRENCELLLRRAGLKEGLEALELLEGQTGHLKLDDLIDGLVVRGRVRELLQIDGLRGDGQVDSVLFYLFVESLVLGQLLVKNLGSLVDKVVGASLHLEEFSLLVELHGDVVAVLSGLGLGGLCPL